MPTNNGSNAQNAQYNLLVGTGSAYTNLAPSATSGVPLISQGAASNPAYGTAVVAGGGTGVTSNTAYSVLCGGTTSTNPIQSVASVGSLGQVLVSNGAGALPTFQTAASPSYKGFSVRLTTTASNVTGDGTTYTVLFNTNDFDSNSGYNAATGLYTVPIAGKWFFYATVSLGDLTSSHTQASINLEASSSFTFQSNQCSAAAIRNSGNSASLQVSGFFDLTVGQTVKTTILVANGTKVVDALGNSVNITTLNGFLVGL
jgi:hypothetical protein